MTHLSQGHVRVVVYEPLSTADHTTLITTGLTRLRITHQVVVLGWQQDGWRCGYLCLYVYYLWLSYHGGIGVQGREWPTPPPPPGWWTLWLQKTLLWNYQANCLPTAPLGLARGDLNTIDRSACDDWIVAQHLQHAVPPTDARRLRDFVSAPRGGHNTTLKRKPTPTTRTKLNASASNSTQIRSDTAGAAKRAKKRATSNRTTSATTHPEARATKKRMGTKKNKAKAKPRAKKKVKKNTTAEPTTAQTTGQQPPPKTKPTTTTKHKRSTNQPEYTVPTGLNSLHQSPCCGKASPKQLTKCRHWEPRPA